MISGCFHSKDNFVADMEDNLYTLSAGLDAYAPGVRLPEWRT